MTLQICKDLLLEILFRLPYKSLIRFLVISKSLHILICNSTFSVSLPVAMTGFVYRTRDGNSWGLTPHYFSLDGRPIDLSSSVPSRSPIACSSNGLLLLRRRISGDVHYYICNPTLRTGSALPYSSHLQLHDHIAAGVLFDPRASPHYKVVEVAQNSANGTVHFQVFSSDTGQWLKPKASYKLGSSLYTLHARDVVCGGRACVYMLLRRLQPNIILVVDIEEERVGVVELPTSLDCGHPGGGAALWISLGVSRGQLQLFCTNRKGISMWERSGKVNSDAPWELKHCEHGQQARATLRGGRITPRVVHVEGDEAFVWTGNQILVYDLQGRSWKVIKVERIAPKRSSIMTPMIPYAPCLVSPSGAKAVSSKKRKHETM